MNTSSNNEDYRSIIEEIQKNHDSEYSANHDFNIRRGKLLLFLLSTLGEPAFFKWLSSATPKGNYYEFRQYKIMRRPERIKDTVQIDNYEQFKKAIRQFAGKDIDNPDLITILQEYLYSNKPSALSNAQAFLDASVLLTAKLARFLSRPRHLPGDVINFGDSFEVNSVNLIDLYRQQENLESDQDAVDRLYEKFEISKNTFEPVKIDKRTHWTQVAYHGRATELTVDSAKTIDFVDGEKFWGRVILKDGKIDDILTYWTKDLSYTPYRELHVPFTSYLPLWNLNDIRKNGPKSTVILTDSLCLAHQAHLMLQQKIQSQKNIYKILMEPLDENGHLRSQFQKEIQKYIEENLQKKFSNIDNQLLISMESILYQYFMIKNGITSQYWKTEIDLSYRFLNDKIYIPNEIEKRKEIYAFWKTTNSKISYSDYRPGDFEQFKEIFMLIPEFINSKLKEIELKLAEENRIAISSWYGGVETIFSVDFLPLQNRQVIFVLRDETLKSFRLAYSLKTLLEQHSIQPSELTFALPGTPHFKECSPEELFVKAKKIVHKRQEPEPPGVDTPSELVDSIDLNDLETLVVKEAPFLMRPLIRRASITMIYSEPNVGKTFLAQSMAIAMLTGSPLFHLKSSSWKAERPLRVLYIDSEMSKAGFDKRLRMLARFYTGKSKDKIELKRKLVANSNWNLAGEDSLHRDMVSRMLSLGTKEQIDIVFFDNLSTLTFGNDSQKSWMTFFSWLRELADNGVASCCLHHAAKSGEQRGTSLRSATVDNIIRLRKALPGQRRNLALTLTVEKARDVGGEELTPLQIELKCFDKEKDDWRWVTTLAHGRSSANTQKRNEMIQAAYKSKAFSIKILADYFGIEPSYLKQILADAPQSE